MLVIGTRRSALATWQAEYIAAQLARIGIESRLEFITTQGDRVIDRPLPEIGGKGLFTQELESALRAGDIDLAVHSLKDLPTQLDDDFVLAAVPERAAVFDALISRSELPLMSLPHGATIGTSSLRRSAQIKTARPDLQTLSLRGNVPTRVEKAHQVDGPYDAIVLAVAGLDRLGLEKHITEIISPALMLPAPAQGALGLQCRTADDRTRQILKKLDHAETHRAVDAERAFLNRLDSGCKLPVAAFASLEGGSIRLVGRICSLDGTQVINIEGTRSIHESVQLGQQVADEALNRGAGEILEAIRKNLDESISR